MQVTQEQVNPCKVVLTITIEPEKVAAAREKAFNQFARNIQLPGFRRGKVPPQMARSYVSPDDVRQRTMEMLLEPAYSEALQETGIEPFAQPDLELKEMNEGGPMVFAAHVPLTPVIMLGPYKGLDIERRVVEVTDANVESSIETLRGRYAEYPQIEGRMVQMGDLILAEMSVKIEGEETPELDEARGTVIEVGKNVPDFDNGLVGMEIGESREIDALYPDDYEDEGMRGKRAHFSVDLKEIRERTLPEVDEEFLKKAYPSAKTVEELHTQIRENLVAAGKVMTTNMFHNQLVESVVRTSQVHYPDSILRAELQETFDGLQEQIKHDGITFEQYLAAQGMSPQDWETRTSQEADRRIRNSLVLAKIAETEKMQVTAQDVEAAILERAERTKVSAAAVRAYVEKHEGMDSLRDQILTEKILTFLENSSHVTERIIGDKELEEEGDDEIGAGDMQEALLETAQEIKDSEPPAPAAPLAIQSAARPRRSATVAEGADSTDSTDSIETTEGENGSATHAEAGDSSTEAAHENT